MSHVAVGSSVLEQCDRCVMDASAAEFVKYPDGTCSFCRAYLHRVEHEVFRGDEAQRRRDAFVTAARSSASKAHDCLIGVSGGADSTYVAYMTVKLGLRPIAVHLDNGWNTELAVHNIHSTLEALGIPLITEILDWNAFRDLQLSFLKAGIGNAEIPTDHTIVATLFRHARDQGLRYIVTGGNIRTEAIMPDSWMYDPKDLRLIKSVQKTHGSADISKLPLLSQARMALEMASGRRKFFPILNVVDYDKTRAKEELAREVRWRDYGGKHHESTFTRWFQTQYLPERFGIDKRKAHLSCLIMGGEITRDEAMTELASPAIDSDTGRSDREFVAKKFGLSEAELLALQHQPPGSHTNYRNTEFLWRRFGHIAQRIRARAIRPE